MSNYCPMPLRYKISSWNQLPNCRSNNDRSLRIRVAEITNFPNLIGFKISVEHPMYGILFSEVLNAKGTIITSKVESDTVTESAFELDTQTILKELRKFGFYVSYDPRTHLSREMIDYLLTLRGLGFDKIRVLSVRDIPAEGVLSTKWYTVCFQSCKLSYWLSNTHVATAKEFTDALLNGTANNISEMSSAKGFDWSWLDYVANIDDILRENLSWNREFESELMPNDP